MTPVLMPSLAWLSKHSIQPDRSMSHHTPRFPILFVAFFQDRPEVSNIVDVPILEFSIDSVSFNLSVMVVSGYRNAR